MSSSEVVSKSRMKNLARKEKRKSQKGMTETQKREAGYRDAAGFTSSNRRDIVLSTDSPEMTFAKNLGATDQKMRHKTAMKLRQYISARSSTLGFSELDFLKLNKAIFMCVWLCDKRPVQEELTDIISPIMHVCGGELEDDIDAANYYWDDMVELEEGEGEDDEGEEDEGGEDEGEEDEEEKDKEIDSFDDEEEESEEGGDEDEMRDSDETASASEDEGSEEDDLTESHVKGVHLSTLYLSTFYQTMIREWPKLDIYRLDKFYSLIRKVVSETFKYMDKRFFHPGIIAQFNDVLLQDALTQLPNGVRFHIANIALEELAKVNPEVDTEQFKNVIDPFLIVACKDDDKTFRSKIMEHIFLKFLVKYSSARDEVGDGEDEEPVFENVDVEEIGDYIFEAGADEDTGAMNRKVLYDMNKTYAKRVKKRRIEEEEAAAMQAEIAAKENGSGAKAKKQEKAKKVAKGMGVKDVKEGKSEEDSKEGKEKVGTTVDDSSTKKKKGKKKKTQEDPIHTPPPKKRRPSVDIHDMNDSDDEPPKRATRSSTSGKTIRFGKNHSKSFKSSMKDLRNGEVMVSPPPGNGVLKKPRYSTPENSKSKGKKRRKAVDYF